MPWGINMVGDSVWFGPNHLSSEENRRNVAAMWVNYSDTIDGVPIYEETEWTGGALDMVGALGNLLMAVTALQVYGPAAEIKTEIKPRLEYAEKILEAEGWKFDPDTKKIRELPTGDKGRPGGFLARCCVAVYLDQYDGKKLTAGVLQGVKKTMSQFIHEEDLDASQKGAIYWSLRNRGVGPHNRKRAKTAK